MNEDFADLEDRLQVECAREVKADYIITRNTSDFQASPIQAILPEDFLQKLEGTSEQGMTKLGNTGFF